MKAGSIVTATAGKDRGRLFLVLEVRDGMAFIANGRRRRVQKPKKKSIKHLQEMQMCDGQTAALLQSGAVTNRILRKTISPKCEERL